jgi:hypothetical protein
VPWSVSVLPKASHRPSGVRLRFGGGVGIGEDTDKVGEDAPGTFAPHGLEGVAMVGWARTTAAKIGEGFRGGA